MWKEIKERKKGVQREWEENGRRMAAKMKLLTRRVNGLKSQRGQV
jgi:hypothetical protein